MNKRTFLSLLFGVIIMFLLVSTNNSNKNDSHVDQYTLSKKEMIKHVNLAVSPKYKSWVLFKHGTYIIIEATTNIEAIANQGLEKMREFGPVYVGTQAGDFGTTTLTKTEGWVVSGHGYGMYTYVHPSEIIKEKPKDHEIGLYGRSKRDKDGANPEIVCISSNGKILEK